MYYVYHDLCGSLDCNLSMFVDVTTIYIFADYRYRVECGTLPALSVARHIAHAERDSLRENQVHVFVHAVRP